MSWNTIIGQTRVKSILQRALHEHAISHAYCFYGNDGIGKEALAFELSKVLNCADVVENDNGEFIACDQCKSCRDADHFEHPNIRLITPLPAIKAGSDGKSEESPLLRLSDDAYAEYQTQILVKIENPYHTIRIPNSHQIRIASIRDIKKQLKMSAIQEGRRCFIISDADTMTSEAANAFLKTLEEPHDNVMFILITSHKDILPHTILSRCQQVYCDLIPSEELIAWLQHTQNISQEESVLIQAFAQGSLIRAIEFLDEDMQGVRLDSIDLLRISLKKGRFLVDLFSMIDSIIADKNRSKVELLLHLMYVWLRDCYYCIKSPDNHSLIVNIDQIETIQKFIKVFPHADYPVILKAIEESIEMVKRNVQMQLVLSTLMLSCRRTFLYNSTDFNDISPFSGHSTV